MTLVKIPYHFFLICFATMFIFLNVIFEESKVPYFPIQLLWFAFLVIHFLIGIALESSNRRLVNTLANKGYAFKSIFDANMVNKKPIMTFVRAWYFCLAWPHYLIFIARRV